MTTIYSAICNPRDQMEFEKRTTLIGSSAILVLLCLCTVLAAGAYGREISLIAATAQEPEGSPVVNTSEKINVLEDVLLRAWCLIGAVVGAWVTLVIFPKSDISNRELIAKFAASAGCGVVFTPIVLFYTGLPQNVDIIAGVSTLVSIVSLSALTRIIPMIVSKFEKGVGDKLTREK